MGDEPGSGLRFTGAARWAARREGPGHSALVALDRATATLERPVEAAGGGTRLNPLHHTGPIAVFLFVVAFATGVYVTMFYRFGFEASYDAVAAVEGSLVGRVVRAAHRYSSIALVVVSLLHGWRTFVMGRFQKPRRTAWVTGVAMVAVVWLIGVTGYWLIWDERAQVLNEALRRVLAQFRVGLDFMLDNVLTSAAEPGWPFLLLIFLIHFFLSLAVAILIWYHVRHLARPQWMPSSFWIAVVGGSLLLASIVLPLGMLPPLDASSLVGRVNLDPFFLFLLPLAISWPAAQIWGGTALAMAAVVTVPWLMRRKRPAPVSVIDERCIGCTWCAVDCPYDAISMVDNAGGQHLHLAVVDASRCVSCGICLGSCPTKALALEGAEPGAMWHEIEELAASGVASISITCLRHAERNGDFTSALVVPCIGMVPPSLLEAASDARLEVELVGCPLDDCTYREGASHAAGRLAGTRPPRLRRAYANAFASITLAPPGRTAARKPPPPPTGPSMKAAPVVALTGLVALASIWISGWTYDVGDGDTAALTISLDHRAGFPLVGDPATEAAATGQDPRLTISIDGAIVFDEVVAAGRADGPNTALLWERFDVAPGTHELLVLLEDDAALPARVLFEDVVAMAAGDSVVLEYRDKEVVVAADAGAALFDSSSQGVRSGCAICHSLDPGVELVGPSLAGVADRAGSTVPGLTASEYLRQSILDPDAYLVPGYPPGQMLQDTAERLSDDQIDQLVAFMLTLESE